MPPPHPTHLLPSCHSQKQHPHIHNHKYSHIHTHTEIIKMIIFWGDFLRGDITCTASPPQHPPLGWFSKGSYHLYITLSPPQHPPLGWFSKRSYHLYNPVPTPAPTSGVISPVPPPHPSTHLYGGGASEAKVMQFEGEACKTVSRLIQVAGDDFLLAPRVCGHCHGVPCLDQQGLQYQHGHLSKQLHRKCLHHLHRWLKYMEKVWEWPHKVNWHKIMKIVNIQDFFRPKCRRKKMSK